MEKSFIFNSNNGDRRYKAEDFVNYFNKFITNGVFPNVASNLQVIADGTNMTVRLKAGAAWVNGRMYENTDDLILPIDVADGVFNRIDRIVIQCHFGNREILAKVKKGVFASSPIAPTLQRDADIYELGIADISVNKGITSVTQALVTDLRLNTTTCGMVNSLLQADTTAIFNQFQDWFNTTKISSELDINEFIDDMQQDFNNWFESVKGQLSGDVATNLANQIAILQQSLALKLNADKVGVASGVASLDNKKRVNQDSILLLETKLNEVNGKYTKVEYRKYDGTLFKVQELSNPDTNGNFLTQTIKYYKDDGITQDGVDEKFSITYDANGVPVREVPIYA